MISATFYEKICEIFTQQCSILIIHTERVLLSYVHTELTQAMSERVLVDFL